jgi:hypothetical protein
MDPLRLSMLMHLLGFGILCSTVIGSLLLDSRYRHAGDFGTKSHILSITRPLDLLAGGAFVAILISGIVNMRLLSYGWLTTPWLGIKIALFILAAATGVALALRGRQRMKLAAQLADGTAPRGKESALGQMDAYYRLLIVVQAFLVLAILLFSVYKPGQYGV